jgi:hypothetical protein
VSSVPEVQGELLDILQAQQGIGEAFEDVLVRFGAPLSLPRERERVYVIDATGYRRGGGEQFRIESFGLRLIVEVYRAGDDPQGAVDRKWELIEAVDQALMDKNFHGYETEGGTLTEEPQLVAYDKGYLAYSLVTITNEDRI